MSQMTKETLMEKKCIDFRAKFKELLTKSINQNYEIGHWLEDHMQSILSRPDMIIDLKGITEHMAIMNISDYQIAVAVTIDLNGEKGVTVVLGSTAECDWTEDLDIEQYTTYPIRANKLKK